MYTRSALLVLLVAVAASGNIPDFLAPGQCPAMGSSWKRADERLNFNKFSGLWYEYAVTGNPFQTLAECVRNDYVADGDTLRFTSYGRTEAGLPYKNIGIIQTNPHGEPHFNLDVEDYFSVPFHVVATDYKNFACIYSCLDFSAGLYSDVAVILGRYPYLTSDYVRKCHTAFKSINVDVSRFTKTVQDYTCHYNDKNTF
ncbi:crustacyanin-C1 subunit-like [Panulirus ornatus]|uniref:crustacyanin-C1 subunit-like n=1 Tax=Panulirus ornatus TaxID=150431 RepID=UPI003A8C0707